MMHLWHALSRCRFLQANAVSFRMACGRTSCKFCLEWHIISGIVTISLETKLGKQSRMASSLSLLSPCSNAASIGLHSSAHDAFSSYPYLIVSTAGLRRRQLPQILSSNLVYGRHWKASAAGDTGVHAESIDIERSQEKNVRSLLPLYTREIESSESSFFTQCHIFTFENSTFLTTL